MPCGHVPWAASVTAGKATGVALRPEPPPRSPPSGTEPGKVDADRCPGAAARQASLWEGGYRYWIFVTNDHHTDAVTLESEHRQKAVVETGMAELKSNFGLHAFRKHGFMANWAWLLVVCLGHNLCCWAQHLGALGGGRDSGGLRAKRLRYRYLCIPAMLVRSGRRFILRLAADHPFRRRLVAALDRLRRIGRATAG